MNISDKIKQIINDIEKEVDKEQVTDTGSYQIGVIQGLEWALDLTLLARIPPHLYRWRDELRVSSFYKQK